MTSAIRCTFVCVAFLFWGSCCAFTPKEMTPTPTPTKSCTTKNGCCYLDDGITIDSEQLDDIYYIGLIEDRSTTGITWYIAAKDEANYKTGLKTFTDAGFIVSYVVGDKT